MSRFVLAALLLICATPTRPTDRYFPDRVLFSTNGAYRFEAHSPDNAKGTVPFARNFTYSLYEAATKKLLWQARQGEDECSLTYAWVSDRGLTVIRTGWDELLLFRQDGTVRTKLEILKTGFGAEERKQYVHDTTAGPQWSSYSLWYFTELGTTPVFIVRPWWGHRLAADFDTGAFRRFDDVLTARCEKDEKEYVLKSLQAGVEAMNKLKPGEGSEKWGSALWPTLEGAWLAGVLKVPEALPFLSVLETSDYGGSSCSCSMDSDQIRIGGIHPFSWSTFTLRQGAQLSIRRLGGKPAALPATEFAIRVKKGPQPKYEPPSHPTPRSERVGRIKKDMKPREILDNIGPPDFVLTHDDGYWEYDIDAAETFTFRVKFKSAVVESVESFIPAAWQGPARDEAIIR